MTYTYIVNPETGEILFDLFHAQIFWIKTASRGISFYYIVSKYILLHKSKIQDIVSKSIYILKETQYVVVNYWRKT